MIPKLWNNHYFLATKTPFNDLRYYQSDILAFLVVRKWESELTSKVIGGIAITFILATLFYFLAIVILL